MSSVVSLVCLFILSFWIVTCEFCTFFAFCSLIVVKRFSQGKTFRQRLVYIIFKHSKTSKYVRIIYIFYVVKNDINSEIINHSIYY